MGAFPIQSSTACANEWIESGENGLIVPPEDPQLIASAIRKALSDDKLVDRASRINTKIAAERLDRNIIRPHVVNMYKNIYKDIESKK